MTWKIQIVFNTPQITLNCLLLFFSCMFHSFIHFHLGIYTVNYLINVLLSLIPWYVKSYVIVCVRLQKIIIENISQYLMSILNEFLQVTSMDNNARLHFEKRYYNQLLNFVNFFYRYTFDIITLFSQSWKVSLNFELRHITRPSICKPNMNYTITNSFRKIFSITKILTANCPKHHKFHHNNNNNHRFSNIRNPVRQIYFANYSIIVWNYLIFFPFSFLGFGVDIHFEFFHAYIDHHRLQRPTKNI